MGKAKIEFRLLKKDEIDCRIAMVSQNGLSLLLYKDARVDQNILDETVGPMGWQRRHCRDNANCIVSIWDDDKNQWIEKEDTGTESNTEKEKGLASDSFKRACFNWGIGRELYTAPFIWISSRDCEICENGMDRNGKVKYSCYDRFYVSRIGYDDNRNINSLEIKRCKSKKVVYKLGQSESQQEQNGPDLVSEAHINTLLLELQRTGVGKPRILQNYKLSDIRDMNIDQFRDAMDVLKKKPNKPIEPDPETIPPDELEAGLPWN
ncbi:hypothetical protein GPL26_16400 [Enterocloster citroniae]|uniref:Uncharacterized protein n=1 Tax=Enterocloster citroniae TaxID=358743 RepID=A0AA41FH33_9FIRM|nr:hypothetical protein [Enterocloster citroniae]MBT9811207.1 hypothetical protein [Enterocloster citroniae]